MSLWTLAVVTLAGDEAEIQVAPSSSPSEVLAALGEFVAAEVGVQLDLLHEEQMLTWDTALAESSVADGSTLTLVRTTLSEAQQQANNEALIQAAISGQLEEVKRLLFQARANVEANNEFGQTPLHWAAISGHVAVARCLIQEAGANVEASDKGDWTPLHFAAKDGQIEVARCLVQEAGANANATKGDGDTPLHLAAYSGHMELVKWLVLEARAEVNARSNGGETPLFWAERWCITEVAEFLRANGGRS